MYKQASKYLLVGLVNTAVGLSVIFFLMLLGVNAYISNIIGYLVGLINSFILNKKFVFKTTTKSKKEIYFFIMSFVISYSMNLITLYFLVLLEIDIYISQFFSMLIFTVSNFLLNKYFTFKIVKQQMPDKDL